jgi:hypothetical protein
VLIEINSNVKNEMDRKTPGYISGKRERGEP